MKKLFLFCVVVLLVSCDEGQFVEDYVIEQVVEVCDTATVEPSLVRCNDEKLDTAICCLLQEKMTKWQCSKGVVYVVETAIGALKAKVGLVKKDPRFVFCEDTYNDEQSVMMSGPTYLALLSSGYKPDDVIDTGSGIYKNVKDHNWHRGGYGELTLEKAFGCRSQVAFFKAKEKVFGNDEARFQSIVDDYLCGQANSSMGMLTFYNAIANDGKMVRLHSECNEVEVLNGQIANIEYVRNLQKGMRHAVTNGICKKAAHEIVPVAACCRTFLKKDTIRRMELCAYFPADTPKYTVMVILEKEGLPASAGLMCGSVTSEVVDLMVSGYLG